MKEIVPIKDIDNFTEKYDKTFGSSRNPNALSIYAAKLASLPENESLLQLLATYVQTVLNNEFTEERYNKDKSDHLRKVFENREQLEKKWRQGACSPLTQFVKPTEQKKPQEGKIDFKTILKEKILDDKHIKPEDYPIICLYLKGEKTVQDCSLKLANKLKETKDEKYMIQKQCLQLANPTASSKTQTNSLNQLAKLLKNQKGTDEFQNDVKAFLASLNNRKASKKDCEYKGWKIVDTDDPQDLLLCGTDIEGSCQRVDGNPDLNKCLLAYMMDGKNRMLAIKNKKGVLVARCILRILWDRKNNRPVLFQERIYPQVIDAPFVKALNDMAKKRAIDLGLDLLTKANGKTIVPEYDGIVESLGGPAPFEYVDAAVNGVQPKSIFSILNSKVAAFAYENTNIKKG